MSASSVCTAASARHTLRTLVWQPTLAWAGAGRTTLPGAVWLPAARVCDQSRLQHLLGIDQDTARTCCSVACHPAYPVRAVLPMTSSNMSTRQARGQEAAAPAAAQPARHRHASRAPLRPGTAPLWQQERDCARVCVPPSWLLCCAPRSGPVWQPADTVPGQEGGPEAAARWAALLARLRGLRGRPAGCGGGSWREAGHRLEEAAQGGAEGAGRQVPGPSWRPAWSGRLPRLWLAAGHSRAPSRRP